MNPLLILLFLGLFFAAFIIFFIWHSFKYGSEIEMDEDEIDEMKTTYIFKHPCGTIIQNPNGTPSHYNQIDAEKMAKEHPFYYVKSYTDTTWHFASDYFTKEKK
jgi:hypothetical protein